MFFAIQRDVDTAINNPTLWRCLDGRIWLLEAITTSCETSAPAGCRSRS